MPFKTTKLRKIQLQEQLDRFRVFNSTSTVTSAQPQLSCPNPSAVVRPLLLFALLTDSYLDKIRIITQKQSLLQILEKFEM